MYVALTRAQRAVFIYENDAHLRSGCGVPLFGKLPLNETSTFRSEDRPEQNRAKWNEQVEKHLADGRIDLASNIMEFHLQMGAREIAEKIESVGPKIETAENPPLKAPRSLASAPRPKVSRKKKQSHARQQKIEEPKAKIKSTTSQCNCKKGHESHHPSGRD